MNDERIEQEMWDTFARCVPDENTRHAIALRVITREARNDPQTVSALASLAAASPEAIDAAFDLAVERGAFHLADTTVPANLGAFREHLTTGARRVASDLDDLLQRITDIFMSSMTPILATLGTANPELVHRGTFGDTDSDALDDGQTFRFEIADDLVALGLGARGSADLDAGTLDVRVRRTVGADLPPIVVVAVADGEATEPALMHSGTTVLTASLPWDFPLPPTEILLAVASPT